MFARLFSNTVMDIGTFARFYQEPLTYHLKEWEGRGEVHTPASRENGGERRKTITLRDEKENATVFN